MKGSRIMLTRKNALYFVMCLAVGFFVYYKGITPLIAQSASDDDENIYQQLELFNTVISRVQKDYVDEKTAKELIYGALRGMLSSLDSHSQFMDPEAYTEMKVDTEGHFGGLGIEITVKDNILTVVSPIEDTPAYRAGLEPNDKIIKIEGKSTKNMTLTEAVKKLRGVPGSKVEITVLRPETRDVLEFTIVRDVIQIQSVKDVKMVADEIGYIRLTQFQENTSNELDKGLNDLEKQGMKGLILDLRNNPGGLLNEAFDVADLFIGGGKIIVSTKGRIPHQNKEYRGSSSATHREFVLVVLVNGGSASGSEIVAGAIQDWHRGILIGTRTFGKGSVQSVLPLKDGSALRLTTAKYYTPSGRSIHKVGIKPDIEVKYEKIEPKDNEGQPSAFELLTEDREEQQDEENEDEEKEEYPPVPDTQMMRAIDLIKGIFIMQEKEELIKAQTPPVPYSDKRSVQADEAE